jgi:glycosyltransferase involved in cell wall biosynthesis
MADLDLSVVVTTYQRPRHLRRCLSSLAAQTGIAGRYEIIVVDDGSRDETADVVERFAKSAEAPVSFLTHPHDGFQPGKGRNAGIRAARGSYILFTDGDCIFPRDHLVQHLAARRPGLARAGDCFRLSQSVSEQLDEAMAARGALDKTSAEAARRYFKRTYRKTLVHQWLGSRKRPKMISWNMAAWRDDLLRINGFDERFRGWGCEDDDMGGRLRQVGVRIATVLGYTHAYHLWHPPHATTPQKWSDGVNVPYFHRPVRLARCLLGVERRGLYSLNVAVTPGAVHERLAAELASRFAAPSTRPEIELLLWPAASGFAARADHRIVVTFRGGPPVPPRISRAAHAAIELGWRTDAHTVLLALERLLAGESADAPATASQRQAA